ncbi:MAG: ABC transporter permease [Eubacteriales bacterium]|nr:ABC transporter permease [Eubacteriales bacterium]
MRKSKNQDLQFELQDKKDRKQSATVTVTLFEFYNYLSTKSFIITTLVVIVLIGLGLNLPFLLDTFKSATTSSQVKNIYIATSAPEAIDLEKLQNDVDSDEYALSFLKIEDLESYKSLAKDEQTFGILVIDDACQYQWITKRKPFGVDVERMLARQISRSLKEETLLARGMTEEDVSLAFAEPEITDIELVEESGKTQARTMPYTYIMVMVLYMFLLSYGQMTATSVASEKSTRTMEILITSTYPRSLIYGKVFGAGLAGLFQMTIFGAAYYFFYSLSNLTGMRVSFLTGALELPLATFLMSIAIFIMTYLAYAFLFGAVGSLVSRSEEVSQVITPLTTTIIAIFFISIVATFDPEKTWVTIVSFVPFLGSLVFFVRVAMLEVPVWQSVLAAIIHTVTIFLSAKLAVTIYKNGVLNYGKVPKMKEVFALFKKREAV